MHQSQLGYKTSIYDVLKVKMNETAMIEQFSVRVCSAKSAIALYTTKGFVLKIILHADLQHVKSSSSLN